MSDLQPADAQSVPGMPSLALLMETDHLLDRLGDRGPLPADLDDPLAAALALLATDLDLDPVPTNATRRGLASYGAWPLRQDLRSAALESIGATIDLREKADDPVEDSVDELDVVHLAGRLAQTREIGIRLVPALVAAGAAIVLSMGAAAALSSGETLNPAKAVKEIVEEITGAAASPNGSDALAEPEGRGGPGLGPSGSSGGGGQPLGPGALPGASVSPTAAPSGTAPGADPTAPGTLTPGLLDFLPMLPAPTLATTDGAQPSASSAVPGSGSGAVTSTATSSSTSAASSAPPASSTSETSTSSSSGSTSESPAPSESTTPPPTASIGPTGATTPPDPTETTTSPPPTSSTTDSASTTGNGTSEHAASGESAAPKVLPFSITSGLPVTEAPETSAGVPTAGSEVPTADVDTATPPQATLLASGGV